MHRDSLRNQWNESLYKMIGLTTYDVHEIDSSKELYDIAHGYDPGYDVYLMTHATFRAGLKRIGSFDKASNITKVLGIGMKIVDEAHLEFRDTLIMDYIFNVKRNLYLTATDGRSSKEENRIFKYVFENTTFYKPSSLLTSSTPKKWVEYTTVEINSNAKQSIVKYRVEGFRGMSAVSYGKWVIQYDKKQTHFKCIRDLLKLIYEKDSSAKVLIFLPLIELCTECSIFLIKQLNYDKDFPYDLNIKTINSHNSKSENEDNKKADVIVTTIGSCGTGTDIPGITAIISASPFVSSVTSKQVLGRMRYCGKRCYYYDIYDASVNMDRFWMKSRRKTMSTLALKTDNIVWKDDEETK
jgi:superfamily II DNA or RNA helicase